LKGKYDHGSGDVNFLLTIILGHPPLDYGETIRKCTNANLFHGNNAINTTPKMPFYD
jgi:hypothetical protein